MLILRVLRTLTHRGPIVWNSLPDYINEIVYNELICMIL